MKIKVGKTIYWLDYEEYEKYQHWWKQREQEFPKCFRAIATD